MSTTPIIPRYGHSTLSDVVPSIGAHLLGRGEDVLGLPDAEHYVIVMVDGLGRNLLAQHAALTPTLSSWSPVTTELTCGAPSTTATSLTSLGTGLTPGQHGIVGYSFKHPFAERRLNSLKWDKGLSALDVQPQLTWFERLSNAGVAVSMVAPGEFDGSGLTTAAFRGSQFLPVIDEKDINRRISLAEQAVAAGPQTLTYFYERALDHTGHGHGSHSDKWRTVLAGIDQMVAQLRQTLPDEVRILVTGDHGMIDRAEIDPLVIEKTPELYSDVTLVAGEGRLRYLYTDHPREVAARWRNRLGEGAWVRTRDEAIDEGWFGPLGRNIASRIGDVVAAVTGLEPVLSQDFPGEFKLIGMHGSLTEDEMYVPLLAG